MDQEIESKQYSERTVGPIARAIGCVLRWIFRLFVFVIVALVFWRVLFSARVPAAAKTLLVNDATYEAYQTHGEDLSIFTQTLEKLTRLETDEGVYGLFWVSQARFLPEADQVQLLIRYNNSTLRYIAEDFRLDAVPDRQEHVVGVTLLATTDPTPTDPKNGDAQTTRYYAAASPEVFTTSMYNYRKLIFDGIDLNDPTLVDLTVHFHVTPYQDENDLPYGSLCIYDSEQPNEPERLTGRDRRALEGYKQ